MENIAFNFEEIKNITNPISEMQGVLYNLNQNHLELLEKKNELLELSSNRDLKNEYEEMVIILNDIHQKLNSALNSNLKQFQNFREELINTYKKDYKETIRTLKEFQESVKKLGLILIENKNASTIITVPSIISSISLSQWSDVLDTLNQNSLFLSLVNNVKLFYREWVKKVIEKKLNLVSDNADPMILQEFKHALQIDPGLQFNEFIKSIENQLSKQEFEEKQKIVAQSQEQEKFQKLKRTQEEQQKTYQEYLKLSNKEFERIRRKKKRAKLPDIKRSDINSEEFEISEVVSEKIEKFKSKLDKSFQEKYLIQKDDDKDPLELIRKRKKEKQEEFQRFKSQIKNKK